MFNGVDGCQEVAEDFDNMQILVGKLSPSTIRRTYCKVSSYFILCPYRFLLLNSSLNHFQSVLDNQYFKITGRFYIERRFLRSLIALLERTQVHISLVIHMR